MASIDELFGKEQKHESFGMIGFSRVSSSEAKTFFGSPIRCNQYMALRIKRGSKSRNLSNDWYSGREELIEVILTPNQFAELLTSMNVGDGVPCTLNYVMGAKMKPCPETHIRTTFENEFDDGVKKATENASQLLSEITELMSGKGNIGQKERKEILSRLNQMVSSITGSLPFIQTQFNEAIDKTVVAAKAEVDASVTAKINSLGLGKLSDEAAKILVSIPDTDKALPSGESDTSGIIDSK